MIRSFFLAVGIFTAIVGLECMVLDRAIIVSKAKAAPGVPPTATPVLQTRQIVPPDWAAWTLLSAGVVVVLYSFTIPRRTSG